MSQNTKNIPLDEKSFDISLSGGPIHTDLLFATASFKQECKSQNFIFFENFDKNN